MMGYASRRESSLILETKLPALNNGDVFPDITLDIVGGGSVSLPADVAGSYAAILIYRGSWCPYCNAQLAGFSRARNTLAEVGIKVVALSVDDVAAFSDPDRFAAHLPLGGGLDPGAVLDARRVADADVLGRDELVPDEVLEHAADPLAQLARVHVAQVHAAVEDLPLGRIVKAHEELHERRLAGAVLADDGGPAGVEPEARSGEDGGLVRMGEREAVEIDVGQRKLLERPARRAGVSSGQVARSPSSCVRGWDRRSRRRTAPPRAISQ